MQGVCACVCLQFALFTAGSLEGLQAKLKYTDTAWCGFSALLDGRHCELSLSPFTLSLVAIKSGFPAAGECTPPHSICLDLVVGCLGPAGLILFPHRRLRV